MIVEYVRYAIPPERWTAFETDYATAAEALRASRHCEAYELSRCADDPTQYVLRLEWDSADGHMLGFRRSPEFQRFLSAIRPYVGDIAEMRHYEALAGMTYRGSAAGSGAR